MKYLFVLIAFISLSSSYSQLSNKHWLPPLHANQDADSFLIGEHYVYLATPETVPFQVTVKDGGGNEISGSPFTISKGNPVNFLAGNGQPSIMMVENNDVGLPISNKGLILEGQFDFYVSFRVLSANHAEFLSSKGRAGLGTTFRLGSLPQTSSGVIRNFVSSFIATQDNTNVTLSQYDPNVKFSVAGAQISNPTQTYTVNAGQSVVISGKADGSAAANLSGMVGALLTSDKPIVVSTGNLAGSMVGGGQDFNLDQIVPLELVGKEYVIVKGNGSPNSELPLAIAHFNNTQIYVNGSPTPIANLNAGEYFTIPTSNFQGPSANKNMYISSNQDFFLYQIVAGSNNDATTGFYFIPPLNCFWQKSVDMIPDYDRIGGQIFNEGSAIIAVTQVGSILTVNGAVSTATPIPVLGNATWVSYRISGLTGNIVIESTLPLAVGVSGASGFAGYGGYFSGFGSEPEDTDVVVCTNSIKNLFDAIKGNPEPGGVWTIPAGGAPLSGPNGNLFDPAINIAGIYNYAFVVTCVGETPFPLGVDVTVGIETGPNAGLSSDLIFCNNSNTVDLTTLLGTGITPGGIWTYNGVTRPNGILNPATDLTGSYRYTIPASGNCDITSATLTVTINDGPTSNPITDFETCDDTTDGNNTNGFTTFDLSLKNNEALGTQTGIIVTYHETLPFANAGSNPLALNYYSTSKTIYARLTNTTTNCYTITPFNLVVNPIPVVPLQLTFKQCDTDTDGITDFNLLEANLQLTTDPTVIFSYHTSLLGAQNDTNLITNSTAYSASNGNTVWARIVSDKGCIAISRIDLVVSTTTLPSNTDFTIIVCDQTINAGIDTTNDGFDYFDLDNANPTLNATNYFINLFPIAQQPNLEVSFYETESDALAEINAITNLSNYRNIVTNLQKVWVRIDNSLNNDCQGIGAYLTLIVDQIPDVNLGVDFTICLNPITGVGMQTINATPLTAGTYTYQWSSTNPTAVTTTTSPSLDVSLAGIYTVIVTNTSSGCVNTDSIEVGVSSEPVSFEAYLLNETLFSESVTIQALATGGFGTYEYSLDQTNWQSSPVFSNIPNGNYTVYVRDLAGCNTLSSEELYAITYPSFFTPNSDGYNDTWNISNLPIDFEPKIYIFDRYGKLIKELNAQTGGWDGTFNNQKLPSTDYWFLLEYKQNGVAKTFRSHFSLKR